MICTVLPSCKKNTIVYEALFGVFLKYKQKIVKFEIYVTF